jgi:anthranilate phosphoribosyltransferase
MIGTVNISTMASILTAAAGVVQLVTVALQSGKAHSKLEQWVESSK